MFWRLISVSCCVGRYFPHSEECLFDLFLVSFAKAFKPHWTPFVYFCFYFHHSGRWVKKDLAAVYVKEYSARVLV